MTFDKSPLNTILHKKQQHTQVTGTLDTETPLLLAHEGAIGEFISGDGLVLILFVKCSVACWLSRTGSKQGNLEKAPHLHGPLPYQLGPLSNRHRSLLTASKTEPHWLWLLAETAATVDLLWWPAHPLWRKRRRRRAAAAAAKPLLQLSHNTE